MAMLSREGLYRLLERRLDDPTIVEMQDAEIWLECGARRAILVIDLSGFTRLSRVKGILHFLTVYRHATQLALPTFATHKGRCVKREADNLIATFHSMHDALAAARSLMDQTVALDPKLKNDERIHLCVGIGFDQIIELTDDVFGDEVNITFKLGEDVARSREILLTEGAKKQLANEGIAVKTKTHEIELGGVAVEYFELID